MMLRFKRSVALPVAFLALVAWAAPATAFSKLGREDGSLPDGDGVISTPLPPLETPAGEPPATTAQEKPESAPPGTAAPAASPQPTEAAPDNGQAKPAAGEGAAPGAGGAANPPPSDGAMPLGPDGQAAPSTQTAPDAADTPDDEAGTDGTDPVASQQATPKEPSGPPPDVVYGDNELPAPVRELRAKLLDAAKSGDIEKLRPFLQLGEDGTVLSFGGVEGDPIEYLKTSSGDGEGVETMAIMLEVLESGHIRNEPGTENEIYVWPYFAGLAIDKLTKPQKVELFELITAGDYQEMTAFGAYNFYRIGITPDGKLQFFVAGD